MEGRGKENRGERSKGVEVRGEWRREGSGGEREGRHGRKN